MSKAEYVDGEYYHVYNRGVDKREIFLNKKDYERFLETVWFVNDKKTRTGLSDHKRNILNSNRPSTSVATDVEGLEYLVSVICYCFNPNHYHFILKQEDERGISLFMAKLNNSYTKYFNTKNNRSGSLFSGRFKVVHIDSNEYLLYLSAYVNGNHFIHGYSKKIENWAYCSYLDFIGRRKGKLCKKEIILDQFSGDCQDYEKFVHENVSYMQERKEYQKYLLEN